LAAATFFVPAAAPSAPRRELQQIVGDDVGGVFEIDYRRQNLLARAPSSSSSSGCSLPMSAR
jgi:hypothetical protein